MLLIESTAGDHVCGVTRTSLQGIMLTFLTDSIILVPTKPR